MADSIGRCNTLIGEVLYVWLKYELVEQARFWVLMGQGSMLTAAYGAVGVLSLIHI